MNPKVTYQIKNFRGEYQPMNLFQFFDDGIRKRLPKYVAQDFKDEIVKNIDTNAFGFTLSRRWQDYKRRIGADSRPFVMFGHYKKAITIYTDKGHLAVGFKKSIMHPRAKVSIGKLAIQLEYGEAAKGIPARPLWRKTAQKFFREKRKEMGLNIRKSLK